MARPQRQPNKLDSLSSRFNPRHIQVSALRDANHVPSSTGLGARLGLTPEPQFEGSLWTERRHSGNGIQCAAFTLAPAKMRLADSSLIKGQFVISTHG